MRLCWVAQLLLAGGGLFGAQTAVADLFLLTNGGRIEGVLLNPNESPRETYVVDTRCGGRLTLSGDQVEKVVVKSEAERRYEAFLPSVPDTAAGHWDAAQRCEKAGLTEPRNFHLEQVLRHDPDHAEARRALGYNRIEGRWARRDEVMGARGYVRHRGAWRLPQEIVIEQRAERQQEVVVEWRKKLKLWSEWVVKSRGKSEEGQAAIRAIREPEAAAALAEQLLNEKDPRPLRMLYIDVLSQLGGPAAEATFTRLALQDADAGIRERCLDALEKATSVIALKTFIKMLQHEQNLIVNRAAAGLARLNDPSATRPLIDALITEHKEVVGGSGISPSFSNLGGGLSVGGGPKVVKQKKTNEPVLAALSVLNPGVNFGFDQQAWRAWYAEQNTPVSVNLRRNE